MPMDHCIGNGTGFRFLSLAPSSLIALLSVLGCGGSRVRPSSLFSICAGLRGRATTGEGGQWRSRQQRSLTPGLPGSPWGGIVADRPACSQARFHADEKSGMINNPSKFSAH